MIYTPNEEAGKIFIDDSYVLISEIREKIL
jgi:hypothetical protein